ncbi:MAG: O-antigen ligase family protein [Bryobacterales bacterium]|nr:O-antigen ligase family protein [Bryobacterales bacterium]
MVWLLIAASRNVSEWLQLSGPTDNVERYMEGSPVDRDVLAVLMFLGVLVLTRRIAYVRSIVAANTPLALYFLYCCISVLWSDFPLISLKRWFRSLGDVIMVVVMITDPFPLAAVQRVFAQVGSILIPASLLFIRYFPDLGRAYGLDGSLYWTGVATGKNSLGMLCLIFGIAAVWRLCLNSEVTSKAVRRRRHFADATLLIMSLWLLWIADSKTSLCSFFLIGALLVGVHRYMFMRRPAIVRLCILTLIAASFSVLFLGIGGAALTTIGRDPTLTGRTDMWHLVLQFVVNPWVGAGYESFWMGQRLADITRINGGGNQAHNGYLEVYLNLGWLGIIILGILLATSYRKVMRAVAASSEFFALRLAYFVLAIIYNFTEGSFKMMSPVWISFLLSIIAPPTWFAGHHSSVTYSLPGRRSTAATSPEEQHSHAG